MQTEDNVQSAPSLVRKKPHEMSFIEFTQAIKPSVAVNRFPSMGQSKDMYSYTVYMTAPLTALLPKDAQSRDFSDVTLHALTEKMNLNPGSARDNLKVAEIVAVRDVWMSSVLDASIGHNIAWTKEVLHDYELLTDGMSHPWIVSELNKQRELSAKLAPALALAGIKKDRIPGEVSVGLVVAQDEDFTMQKTFGGEVVTHENRRLNSFPAMNSEVTVSYYRGVGQVVNSLENVKVSAPFIDPASQDLALMLDSGKDAPQVMLFRSISGFNTFAKSHALGDDIVFDAMKVLEFAAKALDITPIRELVKAPHLDEKSGCLAIEYKERGAVFTALFKDAKTLASLAKEFGLGTKAISQAQSVESRLKSGLSSEHIAMLNNQNTQSSLNDIHSDLKRAGFVQFSPSAEEGRTYLGKVVGVSALHVAQDIGRRVVIIHDARSLDKAVEIGDMLDVKFKDGRGKVSKDIDKSANGLGR